MRYRKLDANDDMTFGNQQANFWRDVPEAPAQAVQTRLNLVAGEWYLDISEGTPYQGAVLGTGTSVSANTVIRDRILGTQGVTEIVDGTYSSSIVNRHLSVQCEINTDYGTTQVQT